MITELGNLDAATKLAALSISFLFFALSFTISWFVLQKKAASSFNSCTSSLKADSCSRVNSTIHSFVIVPAMLYAVFKMDWDYNFDPKGSVSVLQCFFCFTLGYFACDFFVLVIYSLPKWGVFLVHHIVASIPYASYLFVPQCHVASYALACFLLLEFSNVSLNVQAWLQQMHRGDTALYAAALYTTFFGWIVARLVTPVYALIILHLRIVPALPDKNRWCQFTLIPAYLITLFCFFVFVFVLSKEVYLRWKVSKKPTDVASLEETRREIIHISSAPMTPEEAELTLQSPTRMMMHDASEKFNELESMIHNAAASLRRPVDYEVREAAEAERPTQEGEVP